MMVSTLAAGGEYLRVAPSPKTVKRGIAELGEVEPELFAVSRTPKVRVRKVSKVGRVPETDQKVYAVDIAGDNYRKGRAARAKENIFGARIDLQTTLRGIPDGRIYNVNTVKHFETEATPAGLSKFSGLDEAMTNTRHGKQHVTNVEDVGLRLIKLDPKYAKADPAVVSIAARLHDTLRTLDYDSITRGSHGETMRRMMQHGELKTSKEYLATLKKADAESLEAAWADNAGIKLWDETVTSYRGMSPKQQKKVRDAVGLHTAAKSNVRTSILMPTEAKIIADADRIELARFSNKADWLPRQRKMFTSVDVQKQILIDKYGMVYPTKPQAKRRSGKSALRNAAEGGVNFVEGMITPSARARAANPHEYNIYDSYKAGYKKSVGEMNLPSSSAKSIGYVGGSSYGASIPAVSIPALTGYYYSGGKKSYPYSPAAKPYNYAAPKAVYDYKPPAASYEYAPKAKDYSYAVKGALYDYAPKNPMYDYSPKVTGYDYVGKPPSYEYTPRGTTYGGSAYPTRKGYAQNPPAYKPPMLPPDDIIRVKPYDHEYPQKGKKRRKERVKAVRNYHREIYTPVETLGIGLSVNPYKKAVYQYGGSIDFTWDTEKGNSIRNTLVAPKTPVDRVVPYSSPLEKSITNEMSRNRKRATSKTKPSAPKPKKNRRTAKRTPRVSKTLF